ncbi:lysozyme [Rhizobium leguminosarum]|uniref:lysozyme n=1 Tax=Rhizobium leguminosarum TaxID=384 RepID=UPI00104076DC|nr:lysozyme [Rhizobium leguminosarum]MBY5503150.1 lysozyme [Rhizobium leguminosarum]NKK31567.1 glycoside hydrolase family protein [Rhizobium leguminosarum bv. viciae]TBZ45490.1 glycoside hydrolase [Rhizobium leguminosarum bv. viciae]
MPINKIVATKRGKSAIAAAVLAAVLAGGGSYFSEPATPAAVVLATDSLIKPWEGLVLKSHWDSFSNRWDICYGDTLINGKPVAAGMSFTPAECDAILKRRVYNDYYLPLTKQIKGFKSFPVSVQAAQISGAYNFGVGGMVGSRAAKLAAEGRYRQACEAQTAWNKAGGHIVNGLVKRREMGDAQRIGEAELCVSGLSA